MDNYYTLLRIESTAPEEEVRNALNREQRLWTNRTNAPDLQRQQTAQRQLRLLDEAESVLLDAIKRREYDNQLNNQESTAGQFATPDLNLVENPVDEVCRLLDTGRVADAVNLAQRALVENPGNPEICWVLGLAYRDFDEPEKAIESLKRAIAIRPNHPLYHFDLGNIYEFTEEWRLALQCYERAKAIDDSVLMYQAAQGAVLIRMERYAEGIAMLEECVKQEPENRTYAWMLAIAYADSTYLGWTEVKEKTELLEPGKYATSLEQVQIAQGLVAKALSLDVDDAELTAHLTSLNREIGKMLKRRFMCNWLVVGVFGVVGLISLSAGGLGGLISTGLAALYAASTYIPQYIINQQLVQGKSFNDFGWISRLTEPFRDADNLVVIVIVFSSVLLLSTLSLPFYAFYNLYRYQRDTIHAWLNSSENKERLSALISKSQAATKQTADAVSSALNNLASDENKAKLSSVIATVQSATKKTVGTASDSLQSLMPSQGKVEIAPPPRKCQDDVPVMAPAATFPTYSVGSTSYDAPIDTNKRYCTECGNQTSYSDKYCTECGNKLDAE